MAFSSFDIGALLKASCEAADSGQFNQATDDALCGMLAAALSEDERRDVGLSDVAPAIPSKVSIERDPSLGTFLDILQSSGNLPEDVEYADDDDADDDDGDDADADGDDADADGDNDDADEVPPPTPTVDRPYRPPFRSDDFLADIDARGGPEMSDLVNLMAMLKKK